MFELLQIKQNEALRM